MLRSVFKTWAFIGLTAFLACCGGGDDIQGFTQYTDLRLSQLEVSGGTMLFAEVEVERFDPENQGPYRVELDSEESTSFSVTASAAEPSDVILRLVETQKESDGSNRVTEFNSGDTRDVAVDEGSSLVYIEVVSRATGGGVRYNLTFNRVSSSAALEDVFVFGLRSFQESANVSFSEEVAADVFSYNVDLSYQVCNTSFIPFTENQFSTVTVNGDTVDFNEVTYLDLNVGSNSVNVEVTSEDEENTQNYVFNLNRAQPTETDLAKDRYLSALVFDGGRIFPEFRCNSNELNITLGSEESAIEMLATASQEDAEITIAPIVFNSTSGVWSLVDEEAEIISSGEAYSGALLTDLEIDTVTPLGIRVLSSDASESHLYRLFITRVNRKLVFVDTAEELQSALRSAEPGDQIIIAEGEYRGELSEAMSETGSGDPQAYFFSSQSGTAGTDAADASPILLFGEGAGAMLTGSNIEENALLKIQGDHWAITNIGLLNSGKGIEIIDSTDIQMSLITATGTTNASVYVENASEINLNGLIASDVENSVVTFSGVSESNITNFSVRGVDGNAIIISDGSSRNVIKNGDINQLGENTPSEAILIGTGDGTATGNRVEYVDFGRNIAQEAIVLGPNADNTFIQSNYFYADNTAFAPVANRRLIRADGGSFTLSRNEFELDVYDGGSDDFDSLINIDIGEASTAEIFDNSLTLDDETTPFISVVSASSVNTISNILNSSLSPINTGDIGSLTSLPAYQIQSTVDSSLCFQIDNIEFENDAGSSFSLDFVNLKPCMDVAEQSWVFTRDQENYVTISPAASPDLKMAYSGFVFTYLIEDAAEGEDPEQAFIDRFLYVREDNGSNLDSQFILRWKIENYGDGTITIENLNDGTAKILESELDPLEVDEKLLFVRGRLEGEVNRFTLIPL